MASATVTELISTGLDPLVSPLSPFSLSSASDGDKYDGEWRNDERHGKGAMIYCSKDSDVQEKYEGEWVEGRMHGKGCYWYADGSMYDGQWALGKMHGKGIFIYPNGNRSIFESNPSRFISLPL